MKPSFGRTAPPSIAALALAAFIAACSGGGGDAGSGDTAAAEQPGVLRTIAAWAGSPAPGGAAYRDGTGHAARFEQMDSVAAASDGSIWVTEPEAQRIRRIDGQGKVSTVLDVTTWRHAPMPPAGASTSCGPTPWRPARRAKCSWRWTSTRRRRTDLIRWTPAGPCCASRQVRFRWWPRCRRRKRRTPATASPGWRSTARAGSSSATGAAPSGAPTARCCPAASRAPPCWCMPPASSSRVAAAAWRR